MSRSRCPSQIRCLNVRADTHYGTSFDISLSFPAVDVINQFVTLASSAAAPIAPPVAILGLTYSFVQWLSTTALENVYAPLSILTFLSYW